MTTDAFADRLSDYIDDEVTGAERAAIDAHLATCADCSAIVEELRSVVEHAASLADVPPRGDLWPGVAARLSPPARPSGLWLFRRLVSARRFSFTLPQLAAASLAIMVLSGGVVWMARSDPRADFPPVSADGTPPNARRETVAPAGFSDSQYDEAIADLEQTLEAGRTRLDSATVRVLEENLASIDRAIDQSRRALAADPANIYLNRHLADARQRKLSLLRRASALAGG
jgi:hypothetical protein